MTALDLYEATPDLIDGVAEFDHSGYHIVLLVSFPEHNLALPDDAVMQARFVCALDHPDSATMYQLAKDYLEQYLSETTNNDSCHITIDERSAHFPAGDSFRVEVVATILDYMT
jgi:hypothetical protein